MITPAVQKYMALKLGFPAFQDIFYYSSTAVITPDVEETAHHFTKAVEYGSSSYCFLEDFYKWPVPSNFFYDRFTRLVFMNLNPGNHMLLARHLYYVYHFMKYMEDFEESLFGDQAYDLYLKDGLGFWLSSAGSKLHVPKEFKMTTQERQVFRHWQRLDF